MTADDLGRTPLVIQWPDNLFGRDFCSAPHPTAEQVYCRRQHHHPGDHSAYVFKISEPETWPR